MQYRQTGLGVHGLMGPAESRLSAVSLDFTIIPQSIADISLLDQNQLLGGFLCDWLPFTGSTLVSFSSRFLCSRLPFLCHPPPRDPLSFLPIPPYKQKRQSQYGACCEFPGCVESQMLCWVGKLADNEQITVVPSLETASDVIARTRNTQYPPNLLPLTTSIPADLLTPTLAYLKISEK